MLAAVFGGYLLTALITLAVSSGLPLIGPDRAETLLAATMGSFLIYAAIIMAVFHARSAGRAWKCIAVAAAALFLISWLMLPGAAA